MLLRLLLLLTLLGPGGSLRPSKVSRDGATEAPGALLAWGRRLLSAEQHWDPDLDDDYTSEGTDPPEMLENSRRVETPTSKLQSAEGTEGLKASAGPGAPESATLEASTRDSADPEAGGTTPRNLSSALATQGIPVTRRLVNKELVTATLPLTEAPSVEKTLSTEETLSTGAATSTEPGTTEALFMGPSGRATLITVPEALSMDSTVPEALSMDSTVPEALSMDPTVPEALSMDPTVPEALSMESTVPEALPTGPAVTETLSTEPAATTAPAAEPATTEVLATDPATTAQSAEAATTRGSVTPLLVGSDIHQGATAASSGSSQGFAHDSKNSPDLLPGSPASPRPSRATDHIPVKQCLLAILILALVATTFLVCTVVLAVRLSRKGHAYPVRSYSPTEMVCISSLLPDAAGEGAQATSNGGLPSAKHRSLQVALKEDGGGEGDDLTLHSFLP